MASDGHVPSILRNLLRRSPAASHQRALDRVRRHAGGPSLGLGVGAMEAIEAALQPFDGVVEELMASLPGSMIG